MELEKDKRFINTDTALAVDNDPRHSCHALHGCFLSFMLHIKRLVSFSPLSSWQSHFFYPAPKEGQVKGAHKPGTHSCCFGERPLCVLGSLAEAAAAFAAVQPGVRALP